MSGIASTGREAGQVKVVTFGEAEETLQGITDGSVYGTVVENPFEYGRQSVRVLVLSLIHI